MLNYAIFYLRKQINFPREMNTKFGKRALHFQISGIHATESAIQNSFHIWTILT